MAETFASYDEANDYISHLEAIKNVQTVIYKKTKGIKRTHVETSDLQHILWEDSRGEVKIKYTGVPFVIVGTEVRECRYGPDRKKKKQKKPDDDDHHYGQRSKKQIQNSIKMDCPFKIKLKMIVRFPAYSIDGEPSNAQQRSKAKLLRNDFSPDTQQRYEVILQVIGQHENHVIGELAGHGQSLDSSVKNKIRELVDEGLRSPAEIKKHVELYSRATHPDSPSSDRRYYPSSNDVRNHVFMALNQNRYSSDDQKNLSGLIQTWQAKSSEHHFYFRPASCKDDEIIETLLFVHQTKFQKLLLHRYGKDIVLMDSTYKTTKYDLPLFFLCVLTNVGYFVVCSFIVGKETKQQIKEALSKVKDWNKEWQPKSFMCDLDQREIGAVEELFEGTTVYLCEWHREQAWSRWFQRNRVQKNLKDDILRLLRKIASSKTENEFRTSIELLTHHHLYGNNVLFRNWMDKYWLLNCKRWVHCFRQNAITLKVNTTNGVESQNKLLKYHYLKKCGGNKSLSALVTTLTQEFEPDAKKKYINKNVKALQTFRKYSEEIPPFLRERPEPFIKHCLKRLGATDLIVTNSTEYFLVQSDSGASYEVNTDVPSCTCPDWLQFNWPCKHILKIMVDFPGYGWEFLPQSYQDLPCFNLDTTFNTDYEEKDGKLHNLSNEGTDISAPVQADEEQTLRCELLEVMKELQNDIYLLPVSGLLDLKAHLNSALTVVSNYRPDGLPIHKKQTQRKPHTEKRREADPVPFIRDEIDEVLTGIWNSDASHDPVVEVGPYIIRNNSFHFIKSTLSDEVIDACLHILSKHVEQNVKVMTSVIMSAVFTGQSDLHGLLRKENIEVYDYVVGAVNEGGFHWTLIIINPKEKKLIYLNPLGEMSTSEEQLLLHWYKFLHSRYREGLDMEEPSGWRIESPQHAKQSDSTSCGVYVLQFAENFFHGETLNFSWSDRDIDNARYKIARRLLTEGGTPTEHTEKDEDDNNNFVLIDTEEQTEEIPLPSAVNLRPECAKTEEIPLPSAVKLRPERAKKRMASFIYASLKRKKRKFCVCNKWNDGRLYWQCEGCENWFHPSCLGLAESEEPTHFYCTKKCQVQTAEVESKEEVCEKECAREDEDNVASASQCDSDIEIVSDSHVHGESIIDYTFITSHLKEVISFVTDILSCNNEKCDEYSHQRHHKFGVKFVNDNRRNHLYGMDYFDSRTLDELQDIILQEFIFSVRDPEFPATGPLIPMLRNLPKETDLYTLLVREKVLTQQYITHVLVKEIQAFLVALKTGKPLEFADMECLATEVDFKEFIKKNTKS